MSRTLKRPMFRRGGSTNDGIMSGLVDREKKQFGDVAGRARELTPELESLLREFTPKTRLPLGAVGAALVQGTPIKQAITSGYTDFTKKDDAREAAIRSGAVRLGIGQAMKEAQPSKSVLKNRKTAIVNIKSRGLPLTEENIIKETARLNKLDEAGKDPSTKRLIASRESVYLNQYGDGSKARNHASFDFNVAPQISKAGKVPKGRIKLKDGAYDTKRKTPGVYIDVDNGKVIEITAELEAIELPEFTALL
jgi:hypothetical protein|tara:strand:+ start:30 stop:782 length:753 start_codon:yes stop_codon:yes gene_type:complete